MAKPLFSKFWRIFSPISLYSMMYTVLMVGGFIVMLTMALLPKMFPFTFQFPHLLGWLAFFCGAFLQTPPSLLLWVVLGEGYDILMGFPSGFTSATLLIMAWVSERIRSYPALYTIFMDWFIFACLWLVIQFITSIVLFYKGLLLGNMIDVLKQSALTIALYPILTSSILWFLKKRFVFRYV